MPLCKVHEKTVNDFDHYPFPQNTNVVAGRYTSAKANSAFKITPLLQGVILCGESLRPFVTHNDIFSKHTGKPLSVQGEFQPSKTPM